MWNIYKSGGLSAAIVECFVTYLAGHNRPIHEVLFGNEKDIADVLNSGDTIDGGAGTDTLQFTSAVNLTAGISLASLEVLNMGGFALNVNTTAAVNLSALTKTGTSANINGNGVANTITGTQSDDTIDGAGSNDVLSGQGGTDTLLGGAGLDTIDGDAGDDIITGGADADTLRGGADNDTFRVAGADLNGDNIDGGAGADTLQFTAAVNLGAGFTMTGVETLAMGAFALNVNTTAAVDLSAISSRTGTGSIVGNASVNTITGTQGADTIDGAGGNDVLRGDAGADRIIGRAGNDTLTGGAGSDTFVFNVAANAGNADTITDFNAAGAAAGGDQLELSLTIFTALGATNTNGSVLAAGDFATGNGTTGVFATGVNVIYDNATGALYYDSNGGNTTTGRSLVATLNPQPTDTFDFNDIRLGT